MELTYKEKKVLELPNEIMPLDRAMIVFGEEGVSSGAGFQVPVTICLLTQSSISEIHLVVCMWGVLRNGDQALQGGVFGGEGGGGNDQVRGICLHDDPYFGEL